MLVPLIAMMMGCIISRNTNANQFFHSAHKAVLKQNFDPSVQLPCGLNGSVENRIQGCRTTKNGWDLVTRTAKLNEVWMAPDGAIWGDRLSNSVNQVNAMKVCNGDLDENGGLVDFVFKLPSFHDYKTAENYGIRQVLPHMKYWFWSSSTSSNKGVQKHGWLFSGYLGDLEISFRYLIYSVRCLAVPAYEN